MLAAGSASPRPHRAVSRSRVTLLLAVSGAALLAACGGPSESVPKAAPPATAAPAKPVPAATAAPVAKAAPTSAPAKPAQKVKVLGGTALTAASVAFAPYLSIATALGWLDAEGLDVTIDNIDTATLLTMVTRGELDFFIGAPEALLPVEARGTKTGVKFAYSYYTRPWFWLAVNPDSPIQSVAQLKGKTIGLSSLGPPQLPALASYLREAGLKTDDVTTVAVGNQVSAAQALQKGEIDAMLQIANTFVTFENAGFKYRYFPKPKGLENLFGASYYVHERTLTDRAKKDALGRYFRTVAKSVLFAQTNPEAAVRVHWKVRPESKPTGQAEDKALADSRRQIEVAMEHAGKAQSGRWGEFTREQMKAYIDFLGLSQQLPDPDALFTTAFLQAANDWKEDEVVQLAKTYRAQ